MELQEVLLSEQTRDCFMTFLKKEYSQENLEFWIQCEHFKRITSKKELKKISDLIYNKYISPNGSQSINIDKQARKSVELHLKKPTQNMFDVAQKQIFYLMMTDSFPRFLQSEIFLKNQENHNSFDKSQIVSRKRKRKVNENLLSSQFNESFSKNVKPNVPLYENDSNFIINQNNKQKYDLLNFQTNKYKKELSFENEQFDTESLYCNAPIYSTDSPSSQCDRNDFSDSKCFNNRLIRIMFPDCTQEYVSITQNVTIRFLVDNLLRDKKLNFSNYKLFSVDTNEQIELDQCTSTIVVNDIRIEPRVSFTISFPEGFKVNVETLTTKLPYFTIKSILSHFGINWNDIELRQHNNKVLNENALMQANFSLDGTNIYVNYLSSLRTYINLNDINELNEDGIVITDIRFSELIKPRTRNTNKTLTKSYNSFTIDSKIDKLKIKSEPYYANEVKNIDLNELSFSNEIATDNFLTDIMTSDISNLNFVCTPNKKQKLSATKYSNESDIQNMYENINYNENKIIDLKNLGQNKIKSPLHKARFVIIDEHEYKNDDVPQPRETLGLPEVNCRSLEHTYDYLPFHQPNYQNLIDKPRKGLRRTSLAHNLSDTRKIHSPISFTKYLLQKPSTSSATKSIQPLSTKMLNSNNTNYSPAKHQSRRISLSVNNNFSNLCVTPLKVNKPDMLGTTNSNKKCQMQTLSRFHKIN